MREAHLDVIALAFFGLDGYTVRCGTPDTVVELTLTIDVELELSAAIHIHHIFARLLRCENGLILS